MLEGVRLVNDLLDADVIPDYVLFDPTHLDTTPAGQALLARLYGIAHTYEASSIAIKAASDTSSPQGVIAVAAWPELPITAHDFVLICDEIQDPGNLGTIIRSAAAVGVDAIYCTPGCVDVYAPKTVRASMGSMLRVPIRQDTALDTLLPLLAGTTIVAADGAPSALPYTSVDWQRPHALIIGNEAHGLSAAAHAIAQQRIAIPMHYGVESLNAAMAATVILFEAQRQRTNTARH
jgi:TrmH family RNA methyltransferase